MTETEKVLSLLDEIIYYNHPIDNTIQKWKIKEIQIMKINGEYNYTIDNHWYYENLGYTWFLNKEDAMKKLDD